MTFDEFLQSKKEVSIEEFSKTQDIDPDFLNLHNDTTSIITYPFDVYIEKLTDGTEYLLLERSEYYSNISKLIDIERELYIWTATEQNNDVDLDDLITQITYQSKDNPKRFEWVLSSLKDKFLEFDTETLSDLHASYSSIEKRLKDENAENPILSKILEEMEDVLSHKITGGPTTF